MGFILTDNGYQLNYKTHPSIDRYLSKHAVRAIWGLNFSSVCASLIDGITYKLPSYNDSATLLIPALNNPQIYFWDLILNSLSMTLK